MSQECPLCKFESFSSFCQLRNKIYFHCPKCSIIFLEKKYLLTQEKEKAHYQNHQNSFEDQDYQSFLSQLIEPLSQYISKNSAGLDYGCGPEPVLEMMLKSRGYQAYSFDPYFYPENQLLEMQFDFITCSEVFEHFHHPVKEIERLKNLLKPRGILAIMTSLYRKEIDFKNWSYNIDPTHIVFYQKESFDWIAKKYGFEILSINHKIIILLKR